MAVFHLFLLREFILNIQAKFQVTWNDFPQSIGINKVQWTGQLYKQSVYEPPFQTVIV